MDSRVHRYCTTGDTQGKCEDKYHPNEPISCRLSSQIITDTFLVGKYCETLTLGNQREFSHWLCWEQGASRAQLISVVLIFTELLPSPGLQLHEYPKAVRFQLKGREGVQKLQHHHCMPDNWLGTILFSAQANVGFSVCFEETAISHAIIFFSTIFFPCWFNLLHT